MNAQIKKGILELCVLQMIALSEPIYGYDLMKKMQAYFPEVNESTFYAILRRLYHNKLTSIVLKDFSNGPQRKYYQMTSEGRAWLTRNAQEWRGLVRIADELGVNGASQ